jgi:hypothetical protein
MSRTIMSRVYSLSTVVDLIRILILYVGCWSLSNEDQMMDQAKEHTCVTLAISTLFRMYEQKQSAKRANTATPHVVQTSLWL